MLNFLHAVLYVIEHNFGALFAIAFGIYLTIAYTRGELKEFFAFLKDILTDPVTGHASTKAAGFFIGTATLCWSFAKVTLATCRRIDSPQMPLDPTAVFVAELAVIATLVGAGYLFGKYIAGKFPQAPLDPPPSGGGS
jgi:hypothetical protein